MSDHHPRLTDVSFAGVRVRYDSSRTYDELVDALFGDIGAEPVPINDIAARTDSWEAFETEVASHEGPSGFMLFGVFDHGAWLRKAGIDRSVLRVVLGNPLIAITMLRHDVTAGLFAPVELLITDEGGQRSLTYVRPSSLMVVEDNPALLAAAHALDAKLAALAEKVTTG
jgi:uncharacterized protein (DUF302 family)